MMMKRILLCLCIAFGLAVPTVASAQGQFGWNMNSSGSASIAGAQVVDMSDQLRIFFGVPAGTGVLVDSVQPGSDAEIAGLVSGDVITSIAGQNVSSSGDLFSLTASLSGSVTVGIYRYGQPYELAVQMSPMGMGMDPNAMMFGLDPAMIEQMMGSFDPAMLDQMMQQMLPALESGDMSQLMQMMQEQVGAMLGEDAMQEILTDPQLAPLMDQLDDLLEQLNGGGATY